MQALKIASRSIIRDQFFEKQTQQKYKIHIRHIESIQKDKMINLKRNETQVDMQKKRLQKSKSLSRIFNSKQHVEELKSKNLILLKKIWNLKATVQTHPTHQFKDHPGSILSKQKRQVEAIKQQNKRIKQKIDMHKPLEPKELKKKLMEEIRQYEGLRKSIRKFQIRTSKKKRCMSQKKVIPSLKLGEIHLEAKDVLEAEPNVQKQQQINQKLQKE